MLAPSYAITTSSKCSHLANPLHAFVHIHTDYFYCFSLSSFQFINISLLMANSHLQQPSKIFSHLTEIIFTQNCFYAVCLPAQPFSCTFRDLSFRSHTIFKSLYLSCPDTLFLIMSMVAVYLFNQPCCDLDQATNQA